MKPSNTTTSGNATDIIAGICTFPRLRSTFKKRHVTLNLTSTWVCNTNFETWMRGWGAVWLGIVFEDAAVVSAVVLRRPTKEYTHPYSMMHCRSAYCRYWGLASVSPITSIFANILKTSPRRDSNSRANTINSSIRGLPLVHRGDWLVV